MAITYWRIAISAGSAGGGDGLYATPSTTSLPVLQPPTTFKWKHPEVKYTISGKPVEMGKPSVEYTWSAMKPAIFHDLANIHNQSSPTIYVAIPIEHNLATANADRIDSTTNISWGIYKGVMHRPTADQLRTGVAHTGLRSGVTLTISQLEYIAAYN